MRSPADLIHGVMHPGVYHGRGVNHGFFEGWYIKLVSLDLSQRWAIIPGIFKGLRDQDDKAGDEAFVQILDGVSGRSWYHRFDVADFDASSRAFDVRVGANRFTSSGVHLETEQLSGDISYLTELDPWPVTLRAPGIMGWYGHVPFMECFHGVLSFGHALQGSLSVEGSTLDFTRGRGYIEKDWGKAFPQGYIWLASNHIDSAPDASLIGSVAIIPWLGKAFRGFVVGLKHGGKLYRWTTYNKSEQLALEITDTHVNWALAGPDGLLEITAERARGGLLKAPLRHAMLERVEETLDAQVELKHADASGRVLLEGTAVAAGLEIVGDIARLKGLKSL